MFCISWIQKEFNSMCGLDGPRKGNYFWGKPVSRTGSEIQKIKYMPEG